ncbi:hypothetical protein Lal_00033242 [Lupinus albus]|nr:hypothetical protein Lal_00033242 [Lupinus albus]
MVGVESIFGISTAKVLMTNKILSPLTLHCKDKKHDDGFYTLKTGGFHYFDIYSEKRDLCTDDCTWDIYAKGPCKTATQEQACYPWNK